MEAGHICLCAKTGLLARGQHLAWNQYRDITRSGDDEAAGHHQLGCPLLHTQTHIHTVAVILLPVSSQLLCFCYTIAEPENTAERARQRKTRRRQEHKYSDMHTNERNDVYLPPEEERAVGKGSVVILYEHYASILAKH